MAFERLKAELQLDTSGFRSGVDDAQSSLDGLQGKAQNTGKKMQRAGGLMTAGITAPLSAMAAGSAKAAGDFDASMQESIAVMGDVDDAMRDDLEKTARDVAKSTSLSHEEAADSYYYLASAGFDASESMESMGDVAAFAEAGALDMGQASDYATDILQGFGKDADELNEVVDTMTGTFTNHNQTAEDMGEAMSYVAPVASGMGVEIEEASAAIGMMGDAGIKGQRAGTSLRNALTKLAEPTGEAATRLEELGVQTQDAEGNMLELPDIMEQFEDAGAGASDMMAIFGQRAGPGMQALLDQGSDAMRENTDNIRDMEGATQEVAETQRDTLNAQLAILKSNIRDAGITIGQNLLPVLNSLVNRLMPVAEWFQNLNDRQQQTIVVVGALAAAMGPLLLGVGTLLTLLPAMATGMALVSAASLPVTGPILAIAAAVGILAAAFATDFMGIRTMVMDVYDDIRPALEEVADTVETVVVEALGVLRDRAEQVFEWLGTVYTEHLQPLESDFRETFNVMRGRVERFVNWIRPYIQAALNGLMAFWERWGDSIMQVVTFAFNTIRTVIEGAIDTITTVISVALAVIRGDWETVFEEITGLVSRQFERIKGIFEDYVDTLKQVAGDIIDGVIGVFEDLYDRLIGNSIIPDMLSDILSAVSDFDLSGAFDDVVGSALETVKNLASDFKQAGKDLIGALADGIKGAAGDLKEGTKDAVSDGVDSLMPSSDAEEGPLSTLTDSGAAIPETLAKGADSNMSALGDTLHGMPSPSVGPGGSGGGQSLEGMAIELSGELDVTGDVATLDDVDARLRRVKRQADNRGVRR